MAEFSADKKKKEFLKQLIRRLHDGADPEEVKQQFKSVLGDAAPAEIARIEEELVKEGMSQQELERFCDVHLAMFKESLDQEQPIAPAGHPVHILMAEHKIMLGFADTLQATVQGLRALRDFDHADKQLAILDAVVAGFRDSENHYLREENVLFPYLEKHGVTQPPAMMWAEHDKIRIVKKDLVLANDTRRSRSFEDFTAALARIARGLSEMLANHFYKENHILFPTGLKVIDAGEWREIKTQFDELGYCPFTPAETIVAAAPTASVGQATASVAGRPPDNDTVVFETGSFAPRVLEALLDSLPIDITFIDRDDTVRYFSQSPERIFVRTKAIIGRTVQQCHPQKSLAVVNRILADFKSGTRERAEFWLEIEGKLIYIRYFAVRDRARNYLGTIEVTQNITPIKRIEGEKRLL